MSGQPPQKRRLGRGLDALLGGFSSQSDSADPTPSVSSTDSAPDVSVPVAEPSTSNEQGNGADRCFIPVESIKRNPFQPRSDFDEGSLDELAASIRTHGVLQPILVRKVDDGYQLIAGERRWLASKKAGLSEIPCRVMELDNRQVSEAAIEENLKRKDLNVLEKAQAFQDYVDRFGCTIEELGKRLSMDRSTVSNMLRLLELPGPAKQLLLEEKISGGHAKAMLPLEEADQIAICERIVAEGLSVRKTEQAVRSILRGEKPDTIPLAVGKAAKPAPEKTPHVASLEQQFRELLGLKVEVKLKTDSSGQVVISFDSNDDFERITRLLRKAA
ncbi:ParB/RepB/Spo0J family partition protein [bacterium]|nr:ParB/RepB/Spo0J family partition protein [bacterium]